MIAYILFVVLVIVLFVSLAYFLIYILKKLTPETKNGKRLLKIFYKDNLHSWENPLTWFSINLLWVCALIICLGIPFFYQFPRWIWGMNNNCYVWDMDTTNKIKNISPLPWYGKFTSLDDTQRNIYIPKDKTDVDESSSIIIHDNPTQLVLNVKLTLVGKSRLEFLKEMWNSLPSDTGAPYDEVTVFNNIGCELQKTPIPANQIQDHIVSIANVWLDRHGIVSVRARLDGFYQDPNPERTVTVK